MVCRGFILGEEFKRRCSSFNFGDNIFYGLDFNKQLESVVERTKSEQG